MIIRYENHKYLNTDYITHIEPNRYNHLESRIYMSSGEIVDISKSILNEILKKLKIEDIE